MESGIELIKSPWISKFIELILNTKKNLTFMSPFIKKQAVDIILNNRTNAFKINGAISFKLRNFEKDVSDIEAVKSLFDNKANLRNIFKLHAKIYIFDSTFAVISSGNLTPGGLYGNIELGVLIRDNIIVNDLKRYVDELIGNNDNSFEITEEIISESKRILESIPKKTKDIDNKINIEKLEKQLFQADEGEDDKIFQGGVQAILNGLSGWKRDVFEYLTEIKKDIFKLDEVYQFENRLALKHRENKNIQPKIRQQLQVLRDIGLLEFIDEKGTYKKLWK
jgi:phosphatidylserine/phosphatidylglycerophosphate/cardiolipin synthase-like enzyme